MHSYWQTALYSFLILSTFKHLQHIQKFSIHTHIYKCKYLYIRMLMNIFLFICGSHIALIQHLQMHYVFIYNTRMIFICISYQTCRFGYKNEMKIYSRTLRYLVGSLKFSISKVGKLAIKKTATTQKVVVMNGLVLQVKKYIS